LLIAENPCAGRLVSALSLVHNREFVNIVGALPRKAASIHIARELDWDELYGHSLVTVVENDTHDLAL
jgi:hypothetical protein